MRASINLTVALLLLRPAAGAAGEPGLGESVSVYVWAPVRASGVVLEGSDQERSVSAKIIAQKLQETPSLRLVESAEDADVAVEVVTQAFRTNDGFVVGARISTAELRLIVEGVCGLGCFTGGEQVDWATAAGYTGTRIAAWIEANRVWFPARPTRRPRTRPSAVETPGPVGSMTPASVRAAIDFGIKATPEDLKKYTGVARSPEAGAAQRSGPDSLMVSIHTPYARVALLASAAKAAGRALTEADVPGELLEPTLTVTVESAPSSPGASQAGIERVVIDRGGASRGSPPVEPARLERSKQLVATFPLDVLAPGNDIRIVLSDGRQAVLSLTEEWLRELK